MHSHTFICSLHLENIHISQPILFDATITFSNQHASNISSYNKLTEDISHPAPSAQYEITQEQRTSIPNADNDSARFATQKLAHGVVFHTFSKAKLLVHALSQVFPNLSST